MQQRLLAKQFSQRTGKKSKKKLKTSTYSLSSTYSRDIGDSNGNGVRNDVETYIGTVYPSGSSDYQYLFLYAYYLQKLIGGTNGPSYEMYLDFQHLARSEICLENGEAISNVGGMILDSEAAFERFLSVNDGIGESYYGTLGTISISGSCPNLAGQNITNNTSLFVQSQKDVESLLNSQYSYKPADLSAQSPQSLQGSNTTRYVLFINGMLNSYDAAIANKNHVLQQFENKGAEITNVQLLYNFNTPVTRNLVGLIKQYINEPNGNLDWYKSVSDFLRTTRALPTFHISRSNLVTAISDIDWSSYREYTDYIGIKETIEKSLLSGNSVIVPHSQGNFFANEIWDEINLANGGNIADDLRIYALGSPASHIPNNFEYLNNSRDLIINLIKIGPNPVLSSNITLFHIDDPLGHGLVKTYLREGASHTSDVVDSVMNDFFEMETIDNAYVGTCTDYDNNGNTSFLGTYTPSSDGFKGTLSWEFNAFSEPNGIVLFDSQGVRILDSRGARIAGRHTGSFNYDADVNGTLNLSIDGDSLWSMKITCP